MAVRHLNRRRFLKYAGATAAVVGASALGLDYVLSSKQASLGLTNSLTSSLMSSYASTSTTARTTDLQIGLFHDYHGDGQQQSDEPSISDLVLDLQGTDNDYKNTLNAESDGKYWARNIPVGKQYRIVPTTDRYRYVALSNSQSIGINDYDFSVDSDEPSLHLGLMEGFLTFPFVLRTSYSVPRYYDWDPDPDISLWWNGVFGDDPNNHIGIDHAMDIGNDIVSAAPGVVDFVGDDARDRKSVV